MSLLIESFLKQLVSHYRPVVDPTNKTAQAATPFTAVNAAAVALSATPVAVKAAPGAGKRIAITWARFMNLTAAETPVLLLQDEDDIEYFREALGAGPISGVRHEFSPPIYLPANKALEVGVTSNVGDSFLNVGGYIETV